MLVHKPKYRFLYLAGLLVALQYAFTVYINSSLLGTYFSDQVISALYTAGSCITMIGLLFSGRFLRRFGNWHLVLTGITLEIIALLMLAFSHDPTLIKIAFIAHHAIPPLMLFGLDIFFEGIVPHTDTEKVRSYYLTFINVAFVIAPITVGMIVGVSSYSIVYFIAALILSLFWFLVFDIFKGVQPQRYREVEIESTIKRFFNRKQLGSIFMHNFVLQCFFAVMVIFMAPYLHETIGLNWPQIGLIYTIMLLPFALFEAPLGRMFSRLHNESDVLVVGFIIIAIATTLMAFTTSSSIIIWAAILFTSRVGASFVEVASEAAFFKRITDQEASFIGLYKLAAPLAYIIIPLIAGFIVSISSMMVIFLLLTAWLLTGSYLTYKARI
jgi:MFS family permease